MKSLIFFSQALAKNQAIAPVPDEVVHIIHHLLHDMQPHAPFGEAGFIMGIKIQAGFFLKKMEGFPLITNLELDPFLIHGNDHLDGMTGH